MNLKEVAKTMSKKKQYKWGLNPVGNRLNLFGETGKTVYSTTEHLTAEIVTKKLRGMGYQIIGSVPAPDLRD